MVKIIPAAIIQVKGSSNSNHAIIAVVGGVRYKRLVTLVAAPLRIIMNSKLTEPIEMGNMAHSMAVMTGAFQTMVPSSKNTIQIKDSSKATLN